MNPNTRKLKQHKAEWKSKLGNTRRNGNKTGRITPRKPRPRRGE